MCLPACSKAEKEVELVAQDNERMFRQVGTPSRHAPLRLNGRVALIRDLQDSRDTHGHGHDTHSQTLCPPLAPPSPMPACLQLNFVRTRLMGQLAGPLTRWGYRLHTSLPNCWLQTDDDSPCELQLWSL